MKTHCINGHPRVAPNLYKWGQCKSCTLSRPYYYKDNPERRNELLKKWRKENPDKVRHYQRENKWRVQGISFTNEMYDQMFQEQAGCCKICKKHQREFTVRLAVDHDHQTGRVRGLLCGFCNRQILGILENHRDLMIKGEAYLRSSL